MKSFKYLTYKQTYINRSLGLIWLLCLLKCQYFFSKIFLKFLLKSFMHFLFMILFFIDTVFFFNACISLKLAYFYNCLLQFQNQNIEKSQKCQTEKWKCKIHSVLFCAIVHRSFHQRFSNPVKKLSRLHVIFRLSLESQQMLISVRSKNVQDCNVQCPKVSTTTHDG